MNNFLTYLKQNKKKSTSQQSKIQRPYTKFCQYLPNIQVICGCHSWIFIQNFKITLKSTSFLSSDFRNFDGKYRLLGPFTNLDSISPQSFKEVSKLTSLSKTSKFTYQGQNDKTKTTDNPKKGKDNSQFLLV